MFSKITKQADLRQLLYSNELIFRGMYHYGGRYAHKPQKTQVFSENPGFLSENPGFLRKPRFSEKEKTQVF